jgi:hypothetical protein
MRYLRMIRAWACYHAYTRIPGRWAFGPVGLAILPYVGDWAYADARRRDGGDPWGPYVFPTAKERADRAAQAFAEIQAALDKAEAA